jgi:2-oxoglutarate dehydrogenase E1 component
MEKIFTYDQAFLSAEFETYLRTKNACHNELTAFFDGFLLGQQSASTETETTLKHHYRHFGYLQAHFNPLKRKEPTQEPSSEEEKKLRTLYCGSIGYQFLHTQQQIYEYLIDQIENKEFKLDPEQALATYKTLAEAESFETFLHTRFPGQKRFSVEGLESSIVFLKEAMNQAEHLGSQSMFVGMAHRGRLNVLAHIFHKPLATIFKQFSGNDPLEDDSFLGDVKYHQGASYINPKGTYFELCSNPSHLEAVDPVIMGMAYAQLQQTDHNPTVFMIHGDASFAGQGVVYEIMQLSKLKNFDVGGVIHLILNNQIGFTATPQESRSTPEASDLAKSFNCPIFHVNAEDIEAVQKIATLSVQIRSRFQCDVMINLIGYRKWGHNESDEPNFTQPLLYTSIKTRKNALDLYKEQLLTQTPHLEAQLKQIDEEIVKTLQQEFDTKQLPSSPFSPPVSTPKLIVNKETLKTVGSKITTLNPSHQTHPKLIKLYKQRHETVLQEGDLDFPLAELMAWGYLLNAGISIRLVGQDSARGTFSQRHAILIDQHDETPYNIFEPLLTKKSTCQIINSPLSEFAVLGFEYGFSKVAKKTLPLWEAQFGDFANGAQIIIDQFIASGKTKWQDHSNLTLLLPHGYEGQGPEHTSARIERFLELCGQHNMKVAIPSTPKQYFHLMIEQASATTPLIVFTPKALLRHPEVKSGFHQLIDSKFEPFIDDGHTQATIVAICYGKLYYDLKKLKDEKGLNHISLIRLEQLYPLEKDALEQAFKQRKNLKKIVLIQDEPYNMGACMYLKAHLDQLDVISRKQASSPATGFYATHEKQYQELLNNFINL